MNLTKEKRIALYNITNLGDFLGLPIIRIIIIHEHFYLSRT
jgi:hypothetical protein